MLFCSFTKKVPGGIFMKKVEGPRLNTIDLILLDTFCYF